MTTELKNILHNFSVDKVKKKQIFKMVRKIKKKNLDDVFHDVHDAVFKKINCLDCANCCKTTSPIFRDTDIKRLARHLRVKPAQFIDQFLHMDSDQDYVLNSSPCTFLNDDNTCSVYEFRPLACKSYPHTDRKNMHQIINLTEKNTEICPAVCEIVDKIVKLP
jgi:hypothetical protein